MVCTRSMAVTLRKNALSQKTIDSSLLRYDSVTNEVSPKRILLRYIKLIFLSAF